MKKMKKMKKIIFALLTVFLLSSCAVTKKAVTGEYYGRTYSIGGAITLSLKSDQLFDLNWRRNYTGRWETIDKKQILLKFDEITDSVMFLASGVILDSICEVRVLNKNKLKMDGYYILKRQK